MGLVAPGTRVYGGDIIIGKTSMLNSSEDDVDESNKWTLKHCSTDLRVSESGIVECCYDIK